MTIGTSYNVGTLHTPINTKAKENTSSDSVVIGENLTDKIFKMSEQLKNMKTEETEKTTNWNAIKCGVSIGGGLGVATGVGVNIFNEACGAFGITKSIPSPLLVMAISGVVGAAAGAIIARVAS